MTNARPISLSSDGVWLLPKLHNDTFIYSGKPKNKKLTDFGDTLFFFLLF